MKIFFIFIATAFSLFLCACNRGTMVSDDPIAVVNGIKITVKEYIDFYESIKPKETSLAGKAKLELRNLAIKSLVRKAVVLSEAKKKGIDVSDAELGALIEQVKAGYASYSFQESLMDQMVNEASWKEQMRRGLIIEKIFGGVPLEQTSPTLNEAMQYYEKNASRFRQPAVAIAKQIVVAEKNLAEDIRSRVRASPSQFAALAKKHSIGPEAEKDAKIEVEKGSLPEELDRILFESPVGQLSPVVQSPYGFHIIQIIARRPSLNYDFEQVKGEIMKQLTAEKRQEWLLRYQEQLIRAAKIQYNRELIAKL